MWSSRPRLRGDDNSPEAQPKDFLETFGGGIGVERFLWRVRRGPVVETIEDVTYFGKNADGLGLYLFSDDASLGRPGAIRQGRRCPTDDHCRLYRGRLASCLLQQLFLARAGTFDRLG
jgi:hypothetical protein